VILEGIRQQQEAQRQHMLQHQMLTSQCSPSCVVALVSSSSSQDFSYLSHLPLPSYRLT
jgi:hypothetical protein